MPCLRIPCIHAVRGILQRISSSVAREQGHLYETQHYCYCEPAGREIHTIDTWNIHWREMMKPLPAPLKHTLTASCSVCNTLGLTPRLICIYIYKYIYVYVMSVCAGETAGPQHTFIFLCNNWKSTSTCRLNQTKTSAAGIWPVSQSGVNWV